MVEPTKEQINEIVKHACEGYERGSSYPNVLINLHTEEILSLLSKELEGLTVLTDDEAEEKLETGFNTNVKPESPYHVQRILQLQHTKEELNKILGGIK